MKRCWAVLLSSALPVAACPLPAPALQQGAVQAVWKIEKVEGAPIAAVITAGKHFAIGIQVCPADALLTRVDATMPEHQHGMNYRPSIQRVGDAKDGRWRAEGLMFHMPGRWELRLDVASAGRTEKLTDTVTLP
jgi:hypothetical protein